MSDSPDWTDEEAAVALAERIDAEDAARWREECEAKNAAMEQYEGESNTAYGGRLRNMEYGWEYRCP
jgi:hypothetical protein